MDEEGDARLFPTEQVQRAARMEAVGRLAGGMAHDFNNILTAVNGYADLALAALPDGDPAREDILEIRRAGDRGAVLTGQLLTLGGRQVLRPSEVDLDALITELAETLRQVVGEEVTVALELAARGGLALVDSSLLREAIVGLAGYARDAMPEGGRLAISTETVDAPEGTRSDPAVPPGRWIRVVLADTGAGMDADTRAYAFEPFFNARRHGKGAGLRLALAWAIVTQSGGHIGLTGEPGQGCTFRIYLPFVESGPQGRPPGS
jgi:two-component system, cell cycle sensor histidine kinase and response regulator CckA